MIEISSSIKIEHLGTEEAGTIYVIVDNKHKFSYPYNLENPAQDYETLALKSMVQC